MLFHHAQCITTNRFWYLRAVNSPEVLIVGGGLAGLTAALDLAGRGKRVVVVEKNQYPHHKVCGEYVSNEVRPYLERLGFSVTALGLPQIDTLQLSTQKGKQLEAQLPLGGFGISRYAFDHHLFQIAQQLGVIFFFDTVTDIQFATNHFEVTLASQQTLSSKVVLGAYGKRSSLDKKLHRSFIQRKSPWLGLKGHYSNHNHPPNTVGLHHFPGGYGGLSQTEEGQVNFCCLIQYERFKKEGGITAFYENAVAQNPFLGAFLNRATPVFEKPLTIAQICFAKKSPVENHILMCGDTAGLIHPLCGNGMAMAIHSAKLAAESVAMFLEKPTFTRKLMEEQYRRAWHKQFTRRLWMGRQLQRLMLHPQGFSWAMHTVAHVKPLLQALIKSTHGNAIA